jgi:hypothetical protein
MRPGLVLELLQAVPDDPDQAGEVGDGEVGEHTALEHGPQSPDGLRSGA